ncbi:MAG: hypothetical protein A4E53_04589 [Pelotomaculum sp. PtaB.Bin104]|nr:MAG: hypothetical protein A4E53_04589 [Pelotomaculum sp. PtaB.Bin104]
MAGKDSTKALRMAKVIDILNKKSPCGGVTLLIHFIFLVHW